MTQPIDRTGAARSLPEPLNEEQPARPTQQPRKSSVADAWERFEATGDWTGASGAPDDDCVEAGTRDYAGCMDNADTACKMFPAMGAVAGAGVGRLPGALGSWLGGAVGGYIGEQMKDECLEVSEVQCRQKEATSVDACMQPRTAPVPHYTPEDFPVVSSTPDEPLAYRPEDFPVARD